MKLDDINTKPTFVPGKASYTKRGETYSGVYRGIWINKLTLEDIAFLKEHADEELNVEVRVSDNGNKYNVLSILIKEEKEDK